MELNSLLPSTVENSRVFMLSLPVGNCIARSRKPEIQTIFVQMPLQNEFHMNGIQTKRKIKLGMEKVGVSFISGTR